MSALTPHRTAMPTPQYLTNTPSRRALGELTPRAINTPIIQDKNIDLSGASRLSSPLKHTATPHLAASTDKENALISNALAQGKKRSIDEVDAPERVDNAKMLARGRDEPLWRNNMRLTAAAMQAHIDNNPVNIQDPGSPTERNTPSPGPDPEPAQNSQKSNLSFSDLLNYDLCASQKSETALAESAHAGAPRNAPPRSSLAERLSTRLRFAQYKVKTNQTDKRGADIISSFDATRSSCDLNISRSTAITSSAESLSSNKVPNITVSSPQRNAQSIHVKANLDPFRPIGKLGPAPVQFQIPQSQGHVASHMISEYDVSSDSPQHDASTSISPRQLMSPIQYKASYSVPATSSVRLGEDDGNVDVGKLTAHERLQRLKEQQYLEADVAKGVNDASIAKRVMELQSASGR